MVKQKPTETAWVTWSRSGSGSGLVVLVTMVGGIHPSRVRVEYDADPVVVGPLLRSPEGSVLDVLGALWGTHLRSLPSRRRLPQHRHEPHRAVGQRKRDHLLAVPAHQ
jgi:hypothetical protein